MLLAVKEEKSVRYSPDDLFIWSQPFEDFHLVNSIARGSESILLPNALALYLKEVLNDNAATSQTCLMSSVSALARLFPFVCKYPSVCSLPVPRLARAGPTKHVFVCG